MNTKRYLPHIAALLIFFVVLVFFLNPIVFGGKSIKQGDIYNHAGMSKEIVDYRKAHPGEEPLWTNSMFGGMPAYQISTLYPGNIINSIHVGFLRMMSVPFFALFMSMVGFYFLLVTLRINPWLCIGAAVAFGLASYTVIILQAGHNSKAFAMAYMAPVIAGVFITLRGRLLLGAVITALALAFELAAGHLQITYYLAILLLLLGLGEAIRLIREGKIVYLAKSGAVLAVAVVLAVLPNITSLYLTNEYGKETTRGRSELTLDSKTESKTEDGLGIGYATQWSYGVGESFTLLIPDFNGGASDNIADYDKEALKKASDVNQRESIGQSFTAYFGDQPFTSGPVYVGAIFCFLFVLGLLIVKDQIKWWLLAATVVSIMFSWGSNAEGLTEFLFHNLPGYNKFRAVSMILVIACITIPILAMLAVKEIMDNPDVFKSGKRSFWIALGITGGITFLVSITPSSFVTPVKDSEIGQVRSAYEKQGVPLSEVDPLIASLEEVRLGLVSSDAMRSTLFIVMAAGLLFAYSRFRFNVFFLAGGMLVLFMVDLMPVASRYLSQKRGHYEKRTTKEINFSMSASDELILQDKDPDYRVLNLAANIWNDASTSYFHKSVGGYHGAKLKRIQELYEWAMENDIKQFRIEASKAQSDSAVQAALASAATLNMLNTRYLIVNDEGGVIKNSNACGNAWFVSNIKKVANADSEMVAVQNFNPRTTAVVDQRFEKQLAGLIPAADSTASIKLLSYAPNKLTYESNSSKEQLAVFSEIYYPHGWNAYVDGKLTEHFRADYVLRAMRVPAGKHTVEFRFEPEFYSKGEMISKISSLILLVLLLGVGFLEIRKNKKQEQNQSPKTV
ncbi:MAG: YfhO family protein [Bacteroidetes bacterium]|nr:YfhO family protein [Bacteroidota bacterium]